LEIGSNINGINLSDKKFYPFFQAAEQLNCALFIHPWDMMGQEQMQQYWLPWLVGMPAETSRAICSMIFGGVFARYPRLRVAFAHGGGSFPFTLGRIEHGYQVRPDLDAVDNDINPRDYLGRFWVDSLVHDKSAFEFLLSTIGENHICIGSDYPFPLGEAVPGELIDQLDASRETMDKLQFKNARKWLGLKD
ncbi:MAG TPA: amidohydrolase family protein, partial [Chitinophagaceae bacterium]|nr:amidohydrolase family protein [Chitinophagaceae bacterium]